MTLAQFQRLRRLASNLHLLGLVLGSGGAGGLLAYAVLALRRPREVVPFFGGSPEAPSPAPSPLDDPALLALLGAALLCAAATRLLQRRLCRRR